MQVGVKSEWKIPERLYGDNSTGYRLLVPDAGCVKGFQRLPAIPPGREGQKAGCGRKENTAQDFGDAQYRMPVRNRLYHLLTKLLAELYHPLLVTPQGYFLRAQDGQKWRRLQENARRYS